MDKILIRGARTHNLKNIDLTLPRDKLIVITGLSGSGKSSLAFDTLYAEGQRRLAGAGQAGDHDQFVAWQGQVDVLQVVGARPTNQDLVHDRPRRRAETREYTAAGQCTAKRAPVPACRLLVESPAC